MLAVVRKLVFLLVTVLFFFDSNLSFTQDRSNLGDIFRKEFLKNKDSSTPENIQTKDVVSYNILLAGGSSLSVVYPAKWNKLAEALKENITLTHNQFREYFGEIPAFSSSLRLLDEELFYLSTGAPSWTNALFYKGQIMIPVPENRLPDMDNIVRSVKHEYTHAIINALSGGNCPGWLDEGLAQWAEGPENPALQPALVNYLNSNPPVPLDLLQNGFTKLKTRMVPAAYAQSLFAVHTIINSFGIESVGGYLKNLKEGSTKPLAFYNTFKISDKEFEKMLSQNLLSWTEDYKAKESQKL